MCGGVGGGWGGCVCVRYTYDAKYFSIVLTVVVGVGVVKTGETVVDAGDGWRRRGERSGHRQRSTYFVVVAILHVFSP